MTKQNQQTPSLPIYQQVKNHIAEKINAGELKPGMKIESEARLVKIHNTSRMTVNRALRELSAEGRIQRIQGRGSFVAEAKPQSELLQIQSIAQEIVSQGGSYSCRVHQLSEEKANPSLAKAMGLRPYSPVYHSIIVHKNNELPIQLGYRYVNPEIAPNFLDQDFTKITVSEYLLEQAPVTQVEHVVEALIPEPWIQSLLQINNAEPCLALNRKTWFNEKIVTKSIFYYPGSRFSLGGRFTPTSPGSIRVT